MNAPDVSPRRAARVALLVFVAAALLQAVPARADHPSVGFGSGVSGPVITIPAHMLPAGKWGASLRLEYIKFAAFSDSELLRLAPFAGVVHSTKNVISPSFSLAYGFSEKVMLSARLPYVARRDIRESHQHGDLTVGLHNHGNSGGIGDMTVLGQIAVHDRGRSKLALLTGIKIPVGQTHVEDDDGERFETDHQPGSGSWDFLEGIAWSHRLPFGSIDANLLATFASEGAQATNLGTAFNYNVAISKRLAGGAGHQHHEREEGRPHRHGRTIGADLILELNGEARSRVTVEGVEEEHTGGNLIYLSPGLRFGPADGWSFSASVGAPVLQDVNGTQHETDLRILVGFATGL